MTLLDLVEDSSNLVIISQVPIFARNSSTVSLSFSRRMTARRYDDVERFLVAQSFNLDKLII
jgi:hypothetical protein